MENLGLLSAYARANPAGEFSLTFDELDVIVHGLPLVARHSADWWREEVAARREPFIDSISRYVPTLDVLRQRVSFTHVDLLASDHPARDPAVEPHPRPIMSVGEFSPPPPEGPFPPSTWNQSRVGFIAAGHQRDSRPGLASDSYDSPLFKARKHYVEQSCDYYAILSGVHRLLLPNDLTIGGDVSLLRVRHSVRRFWTEQAYFSIFYRISPGTKTTIEFHGSPRLRGFRSR